MEIDTGDSPPISQRPYNLPLQHSDWVQRELDIPENIYNKKGFTVGESNSNSSKKDGTRRTN